MATTGGCLCRSIRYSYDAAPGFVGHCYCRDCQLATGAAFTTVLSVPKHELQIDGSPKRFTVVSEAGRDVTRLFCGDCGTPLFTEAELNPDDIFIKCTTLDDPSAVDPQMTCWTGSAPEWAPMTDTPVSFEGNPG